MTGWLSDKSAPEAPGQSRRIQREVILQLALGPALMVVKGFAAPEVDRAYTRAGVPAAFA
jgi:hypothetical protein